MSGREDGNPFGYLSQSASTSQGQDNTLFEFNNVDVNWLHSVPTSTLNGPTPRAPAVSFQIPQFLHGPPMLAHGGGAEVLPAALFKNQSPTPIWTLNQQKQPTKGLSDELEQVRFDSSSTLPLNLPLYSASGFDALSILSRVFTRPNPQISLGPVDFTSSFCVVDARRFDLPIIHCSPSFCALTGYEEMEILYRNCRFLQAPPQAHKLERGSLRKYTDQTPVSSLSQGILAGKEVQVSLMNYKKDGTAFMNLVTVIPIRAEPDEQSEIIYYVGFQIDLSRQPKTILERLNTGTYVHDDIALRSTGNSNGSFVKDARRTVISSSAMSNHLRELLADPAFSAAISSDLLDTSASHQSENSHPLSSLLLSLVPDFILVLSLKGSFLYCSPAVKGVLGWEANELIGRSLEDICHEADLIAALRELKEGATGGGMSPPNRASPSDDDSSSSNKSRSICLLFRALTKFLSHDNDTSSSNQGCYVWLECRGRLYSEPGKGRKAIILSGRAREMWTLDWNDVSEMGGLASPVPSMSLGKRKRPQTREIPDNGISQQEVWGLVSDNGICLSIGDSVLNVIGWDKGDLIGSSLLKIFQELPSGAQKISDIKTLLRRLSSPISSGEKSKSTQIKCRMLRKDGISVEAALVVFCPSMMLNPGLNAEGTGFRSKVCAAPLVFQIRLASALPRKSILSSGQFFAPLLSSSASFNSSWQYEIQQVRFENTRLTEEVQHLEEALLAMDREGRHGGSDSHRLLESYQPGVEAQGGRSSYTKTHVPGDHESRTVASSGAGPASIAQAAPATLPRNLGSRQMLPPLSLSTPDIVSVSATLSSIRASRAQSLYGPGPPSLSSSSPLHEISSSTYSPILHHPFVSLSDPSADWQSSRRPHPRLE